MDEVPPVSSTPDVLRTPSPSRRFWRTALFLTPLVIVLGIPALVLWLGGELTDTETIIRRQRDDPHLILNGPAYTNSAFYVKFRLVNSKRPPLLALGNSRVMQFRREFFRPESQFYNAGGALARIKHFRAFLEKLPVESLPRTLLVAMDGEYFNEKFDKLDHDKLNVPWLQQELDDHWGAEEVFSESWVQVWKDIRAGKIQWARLLGGRGLYSRIGLNALCNSAGFRNDGSYRYPAIDLDITNPKHREYRFNVTLHQVATDYGRFGWAQDPAPRSIAESELFLDFCAAHQIHVIGFLPPYPHAVWAAMQDPPERYAYIPKLASQLKESYERRGFEFYDFSDCATVGASDSEAIDGMHMNDRTHLRMVIAMLERGSQLSEYADLSQLRSMLASSTPPPALLFPEEP